MQMILHVTLKSIHIVSKGQVYGAKFSCANVLFKELLVSPNIKTFFFWVCKLGSWFCVSIVSCCMIYRLAILFSIDV